MYSENLTEFHGRPVKDFEKSSSWAGTDQAYRLRQEYDDELSVLERFAMLLAIPDSSQLRCLVFGAWGEVWEGTDSGMLIEALVAAAPRLPHLEAIFLGDITYDECELSWIELSDLAPLLNAYPGLREFRVRGKPTLSPVRHSSLQTLVMESGGIPRSVLKSLFESDLPHLEHLDLLLGDLNYGFDGTVADLQPLLSGACFPRLRELGLMNSEIANEIAAAVVTAPLMDRLESLDLSMGNLDEEGAHSLKGLASRRHLKQLVLNHHYVPESDLVSLAEALPFDVIASPPESKDDDWRPILHAE